MLRPTNICMKRLLLVFLFLSPTLFAQIIQDPEPEKVYFSEALAMHLDDYNKKADLAYRFRDYDKAEQLFDSLTNNLLEGSYMNDFEFHTLARKNNTIRLSDFDKPVFLITYASWCVPGKGQIPALNKLANQFAGRIDFVVLFWDKKDKVEELSSQFNEQIKVVYVDETKNNGAYVVKQLKHSLGLPTCFLMTADKRIADIRRSVFPAFNAAEETAYRENYQQMEASIANNLINKYEDDYVGNE